jgi:hypothetical protein
MPSRGTLTAADVLARVVAELQNAHFANSHGITSENVGQFLLKLPVECKVLTPEDDVPWKMMWFVLHECPAEPRRGYTVALDAAEAAWMLVECRDDGSWFCDTIGGSTLLEALTNM